VGGREGGREGWKEEEGVRNWCGLDGGQVDRRARKTE